MNITRRSLLGGIGGVGISSLSGCASLLDQEPLPYESIELRRVRAHSSLVKWLLTVTVDEDSGAYFVEHRHKRRRDRRENLPENNYTVDFPVVWQSDDSYSTYPATGHEFVLIDGTERFGRTTVDFKEEITVSNPGFMDRAHGDSDVLGNWYNKAGGGHTGFTFQVTNTGDFPVQIASVVVRGDIPHGPGPVHKYWPTAVWFRDDDGQWDFKASRFDDDDVHHSLMLAPGEETRVGAMGYNVSEHLSLCDERRRDARVVIKTRNEIGVRAGFEYRLGGQKDASGCTEGEISDFGGTSHFD